MYQLRTEINSSQRGLLRVLFAWQREMPIYAGKKRRKMRE